MKILLDTNVVLDALFNRPPWGADAKAIWQAHQQGMVTAYVSATTVTDVFYIGRKQSGIASAKAGVKTCLDQLHMIDVGFAELAAAYGRGGGDFEDDVQIACAQTAGLDYIITRDVAGFTGSPVPAILPNDFVASHLARQSKSPGP